MRETMLTKNSNIIASIPQTDAAISLDV